MSFPRYPAYKDSGVEWLGEVPEHWGIHPVVNLAAVINGYPFDSASFDPEGNYPLVRIRDLNNTTTETRYMGEFVERAAISADDVIIGMDGDFNVGRWLGSEPALLNQRMCCVRGRNQQITRWLEYALPIPLKTINDITYSTTVKHLASSQVEKTRMALPSTEELHATLAFLDRETAKIDALIAEQERLITLLAEKRQAVISHAVTKGLDPTVPMKDSGVEWVGEVPEHWELIKIKHAISALDQGWSPQCENNPANENEWGVLKVGCVNGGEFNPAENKALPQDMTPAPELGIRYSDLLISRANTRELVGSAAIAKRNYPNLLLCDKLYRLRLHEGYADPEYVALYLSTPTARSWIEISASGASSSMQNISQSVIRDMPMPRPSIDEQRVIVAKVEDVVHDTSRLINEGLRAITLLKERRAALISAAVTGKIDVRGLVPREAA